MAVIAEINYPKPSWLTCLMECNKEVKQDQEVILTGCGHIICSSECLDALKIKSTLPNTDTIDLKCPSCLLPLDPSISMESNKIIFKDAFPFTPSAENVSLICGVCVFNNPAVSYCANCPSYLCSDCDPHHKFLRQTQTHQVTNDLETRREVELARLKLEKTTCKCSTSNPEIASKVTHNCKHCKIGICSRCAPEHRQQNHGVVDISARRSRLINKIKNAKKMLDEVQSLELKLIQKKKIELPGAWNKIHSEVNNEFATLVGKCVKQCFRRKDDVSAQFLDSCKIMDSKIDGLQNNQLQVQRYLQVNRSVKDNGDDQSLLNLTSRIAPLGADVAKVNDHLKNREDFTMRNHCFQLSSSWNPDTATLMNEFAEVNHGDPREYPVYSLGLDGSTVSSVRLADGQEVGPVVERFKTVLKEMEEEAKEKEAVMKAEEEARKEEENQGKNVEEEEANIVEEEEAKTQVENRKRAFRSNTPANKQHIESSGSTSSDTDTLSRPCSPPMPKLKPQASRRVGRPRKRPLKYRTDAPTKMSTSSFQSQQQEG